MSVGSRVRADVVTAGELCIKEMTCAVEQAFQLGAIGNSLRRFEHSYGRRRFLRVKPLLAAVVQRCGQEFLYPVRPAIFQNFTHDVGPEVTITFELCLIEKLVRRCLMGERIVCGRICGDVARLIAQQSRFDVDEIAGGRFG